MGYYYKNSVLVCVYSIIPSIKKWCSRQLASYSTLLNEKSKQMFIQFSFDEKLNETVSTLEDRNEIKTQLDRLAKWAKNETKGKFTETNRKLVTQEIKN